MDFSFIYSFPKFKTEDKTQTGKIFPRITMQLGNQPYTSKKKRKTD